MQHHSTADVSLATAARDGDLGEVRRLLASGAAADGDAGGYTALYRAISARRGEFVEVVRALLEAGADPNKRQGGFAPGPTPLGLATADAPLCVVELLLKAGADVNSAHALHIAAKRAHPAKLKMLIDAGGDVRLSEPDYELGKLPIDVFEFCLAYHRSKGRSWLAEEAIREVRELLAV